MKMPDEIGMNRTGTGASPLDSRAMMDNADPNASIAPEIDASLISAVRAAYSENAEPVGTIPPPASLKGALKTGAKMMLGKNPSVFINKLGERLAFERTGSRLYQAVISRYDALKSMDGFPPLSDVKIIHSEEVDHFEMLWDALKELGADPTVQTPGADIAGVEASGLLQVLTDPRTNGAECLHSLLVAELADRDGWDMLIDLAKSFGNDDMIERFQQALAQEETHLDNVRAWNMAITSKEANS
jgi:hypothetical protein